MSADVQIPPSLPEPRRRDRWQHVVSPYRPHVIPWTTTGYIDGESRCGICGQLVDLTPEWAAYWTREADRREPLRQAAIAAIGAPR